MVGLNKFWFSILTLGLLAACVPDAKKTSSCADNETVNVTLRTCVNSDSLARNRRPIPIDQAETLSEDSPVTFPVSPASDADGDTLNYIIVSDPAHGTITGCMNKSGSPGLTERNCTYTPHANFYGTDSFTYKVNDGFQDSATYGKVTLTINNANDAPTVTLRGSSLIVYEGTAFTYTFSYSDPDNEPGNFTCTTPVTSNVTIPVSPAVGSCSCDPLKVCTMTVTPTAYLNSPSSTFSFDYTFSDAHGATASGTETFSVIPINNDPVLNAVDCTGNVTVAQEGTWTSVGCPTAPIATNYDYLNSDTLTYELVSGVNTCSWLSTSSTGTTNTLNGLITGIPHNTNVGSCTLAFRVKDSYGKVSSTVSVPLTITNVAPDLVGTASPTNLGTITEDPATAHQMTISSLGTCAAAAGTVCLQNGDRVQDVTITLGAATTCNTGGRGTLTTSRVDADQFKIIYTPAANFAGTCDIEMVANDGHTSDTLMGTVTVTGVNDAPTVAITNNTTPATYSVFSGNLPNQTANDGAPLFVDANTTTTTIEPLVLDQGGGSDEDTIDNQNLTVHIRSSNAALIPNNAANIVFYTNSTHTTQATAGALDPTYGIPFSLAYPDSNLATLYLVLHPVPGQTGTTTISMRLNDGAGGITTKTFTVSVTNKSVAHRDWSNIYAVGKRLDYSYDGTTATTEAKVEISWNAFTVYNDTISGYVVYRAASPSGPFLEPISGVLSASTRTYSDELSDTIITDNSDVDGDSSGFCNDDPSDVDHNGDGICNIGYGSAKLYYKVKAIANSNGKIMEPNSSYAVAMIKVPHENMAFMSRRIVNKSTCATMGKTSDVNNYNRCAYVGPGDGNGSGYFDIGADYFVDRFEASCNYTTSGCAGGACIGNDPSAGNPVTVAANAIYYSRASGNCYFTSNNGGAWTAVSALTPAQLSNFKQYNQTSTSAVVTATTFPLRPPIVRISQNKAQTYCQAAPVATTVAKSLMSRLVHSAAADWGVGVSTSLKEEGFPLSLSSSYCNSSNGGSLTFDDGLIAPLIDTWTATSSSSSIFSFLMAGSNATYACQSRYGIQDLVGNVEEWNLDRFYSVNAFNLYPLTAGTDDSMMLDTDGSNFASISYNPYQYASVAQILSGLGLSDFELKTGFSTLTGIFMPLGLPSADTTNSLSVAATTFIDNDDYVSFDTSVLAGNSNAIITDGELVGLASGGHFADGTKAGRHALRFKSVCHDDNNDGDCTDGLPDVLASGTEEDVHTGFRCMMTAP